MILALSTTAPNHRQHPRSCAQDRPGRARAVVPDRVPSPLPHRLGGCALTPEVRPPAAPQGTIGPVAIHLTPSPPGRAARPIPIGLGSVAGAPSSRGFLP